MNFQTLHAWAVSTFFRFRLTDVYQGTLVEFIHHDFERFERFERFGADLGAILAGYEDGWHAWHLTTLRNIVEGIDG